MLERLTIQHQQIEGLKNRKKFSRRAWIKVNFDRKTPRIVIGDGISQIELTQDEFKELLANPLEY